ncbi:MAG: MBL fold metallo-hydrolase [Bdellovibrionales bacterium]|nr:MBL fold metallo-hydrolase [Bdellovibrionales bacterium]
MTVTITFLGAAGTVTGSKYLVQGDGKKILVDAGLFQGPREWREKNWSDPPVDLRTIDAVLLTHAHIDHTGILPRFNQLGLKAPVYCTQATKSLSNILLPDSGFLQEEEAEWRNRKGKSRHQPALPLYTQKDAVEALKKFKSVRTGERKEIVPGVKATWHRMGHILGACSISLELGGKTITFSGDVGRYNIPILKDPEPVEFGDLLLIESTYGDRDHPITKPQEKLKEVINETVKRDGVLVIPSFAVGRAQLLLYYIRELKEQKLIPDIPVIIDSPMASSATEIYSENSGDYDEEALGVKKEGRDPFAPRKLYFTTSSDESKKLNGITDPMIIISASGMLSGGRILHHLKHRISSPNNTVLFVGFQPPGGRGDWILNGAKTLRLLGDELPIRARIESISGLSAHGDRGELLRWCESSKGTPGKVAVVHGEPESAKAFAETLQEKFDWKARPAKYRETMDV